MGITLIKVMASAAIGAVAAEYIEPKLAELAGKAGMEGSTKVVKSVAVGLGAGGAYFLLNKIG